MGEVTSHISGFLSRVIRLLENEIKPVYVFDGQPLELKSGELAKRTEKRAKAEEDLAIAKETGDAEAIKKHMSRTVRVSKKQNDDIKELLTLLGIPIVEAPTEAEAQCAYIVKKGLANATATEDADALTFGSPFLIRHLNFADQKLRGKPILQFDLNTILENLKFTMDQFIDFCILCGCDYCERLKGIGPQTAYKRIQKYKSIENVLENMEKNLIPENFNYQEAREFFKNPIINTEIDKFEWKPPQIDKLKAFLVEKHNFNAVRVDNYIARLQNAKKAQSQTRLESFFGPIKKAVVPVKENVNTKRKRSISKLKTAKKR